MFSVLSKQECERISECGRNILENTGVKILNEGIYELLLEAGALPDKKDHTKVYMPYKMIDKYLCMCPKQFNIINRNGENTTVKNESRSLYYTGNATHYIRGTAKKAVDIGENEFVEFIRIIDRLSSVDGNIGTSIKEYPSNSRDFVGFKLMAQYSYKHIRPCIYTPYGAEAILEMADVVLEGKPLRENMFFTLGYSIVSPLTWTDTALTLFNKTKSYGIPIMINSEPMAGGTSPVTLAGSLAQADAEVISGIIINQVLEPGRPCIYNSGFAHVMDMMHGTVLTGAPENALLQAAGSEMARFYQLPSASWCLTDSPVIDSQSSYEKFMTMLAHSLSNVNMIWGIGNIEASKTISPESAVIDHEMIGNCLRMKKGITVDDQHIGLDVIKQTVFNRSFLETEHTFKYFNDEIRKSILPNRISRASWEMHGSITIEERAEKTVNNILSKKPITYLNGVQMQKLEKIQNKWYRRLNNI